MCCGECCWDLLKLCHWWLVAGASKTPAVLWGQGMGCDGFKGNRQRVGIGGFGAAAMGSAQRVKASDVLTERL